LGDDIAVGNAQIFGLIIGTMEAAGVVPEGYFQHHIDAMASDLPEGTQRAYLKGFAEGLGKMERPKLTVIDGGKKPSEP
jgi:hypothetical protein